MRDARFFINRPRFAAVLSIFIVLASALAIVELLVYRYQEAGPRRAVARSQSPGPNPQVMSETIAAPLEEQLNGLPDMLSFESQPRRMAMRP